MTAKRADTVGTALTRPMEKNAPRGHVLRGGGGNTISSRASDWEVLELRRRVSAGVWSARIALVVSVPFGIAAWATGAEHAWFMYMLLPVVAAFFAGSLFGAAICSRQRVPDDSLAGRRGALVALSAYIIFAMEAAAMSVTPLETGLNVFMGALLVSGWLVFPVAFFAGIMAFRAREGALRYRKPAKA